MGVRIQFFKRCGAGFDFGPHSRVKARVAIAHKLADLPAFQDAVGGLEAISKGVHATDVGVEQVGGFVRLTAALGVKVEATRGESAHFEHAKHNVRGQVQVAGELIGIPSKEGVPPIGVDGTEGIGSNGNFHFVFHGVARKRRMIGLQVELEVL